MKKRTATLVFLLLLIFIVMIPAIAFADEGYDIISHDVSLTISEDGNIAVQERIVLDYIQERHGFYYQLLYAGTVTYQDQDGIHEEINQNLNYH